MKSKAKQKTPLQKSLARIGVTPRKFAGILKRLRNLPSPSAPLKGKGYAREPFGLDLTSECARQLFAAIPERHKCEVVYRRTGGYFGHTRAISPEADKICAPVVSANDKAALAKARKKSGQRAKEMLVRRRNEPRPQPCGSLLDCKLTDDERTELRELLENGQHPFTGRALELKHASGLSWGQIANS